MINFLSQLPPTDPLYIPSYSPLPFSLVRVIDVMIEVLTFLQRAYQPAVAFMINHPAEWFFGGVPNNIASYLVPLVSD